MIQNEGSNLYAMLTWIYKAHAYRQLREIGRNVVWENLSKKNRESSYQLPLNLVTHQGLLLLHPVLRLKPVFIPWKLSGNVQIADRILTSMGLEPRPWMFPY